MDLRSTTREIGRGVPASVLAATLCLLVVASYVALVPLEGVPHLTGEILDTLQSRLFAAGMRTGPPAAEPSLLNDPLWQTSPVTVALRPPGWPALLALGERLGVPWLINPLLGALIVPLAWLLAREVVSEEEARFAAWWTALSPGVWVLAASRMAHTSVLLALLALAVLVFRRREGVLAWALGGIGAGYAVLARPIDALLVGGPLLVWGLVRAPRPRDRVALGLGPVVAVALGLLDNVLLTGHPLVLPVLGWIVRPAGWDLQTALAGAWRGACVLDRLIIGVPCGLLLALGGLARTRDRRVLALTLVALLPVLAGVFTGSPAMGASLDPLVSLVVPLGLAVAFSVVARGWRWLFLAVPVVAALPVLRDLGDRYGCVDASLKRGLVALDIHEGVLFVDGHGRREAAWPSLGITSFTCDPALEAGDALLLLDPTRTTGGLQPRLAPQDPAERGRVMAGHPGEDAWMLRHEIPADEYRIWADAAGNAASTSPAP